MEQLTWILLTYKVPPEPAARRVALWRKLKSMGAVYLQNGVCLLPETREHMRQLKMLENDAAEMGGETVLLVTKSLDQAQEDKVIARFKADRDDQYREFIGQCDVFEAEIAKAKAKEKFTYAELEEEDNDLNPDFYGAPLATTASERMTSCEEKLADYSQLVFDANQGL